jgi:hypothetical protein
MLSETLRMYQTCIVVAISRCFEPRSQPWMSMVKERREGKAAYQGGRSHNQAIQVRGVNPANPEQLTDTTGRLWEINTHRYRFGHIKIVHPHLRLTSVPRHSASLVAPNIKAFRRTRPSAKWQPWRPWRRRELKQMRWFWSGWAAQQIAWQTFSTQPWNLYNRYSKKFKSTIKLSCLSWELSMGQNIWQTGNEKKCGRIIRQRSARRHNAHDSPLFQSNVRILWIVL